MDPSYLTKLEKLKTRFQDIEKELLDPKIASNPTTSKQLMKERAQYIETIEAYDAYLKILADLESNQEILKSDDEEMRALAQEELDVLEQKKKDLEEELTVLLLPKDPLDEKNVMLEIRAGTGGDEASLFAAELFSFVPTHLILPVPGPAFLHRHSLKFLDWILNRLGF